MGGGAPAHGRGGGRAVTGAGRRLLLVCQRFPFDDGAVAAEAYLETEIGLLAKRFDEVLVIADAIVPAAVPTVPLPGNVRAAGIGCVVPGGTRRGGATGPGAVGSAVAGGRAVPHEDRLAARACRVVARTAARAVRKVAGVGVRLAPPRPMQAALALEPAYSGARAASRDAFACDAARRLLLIEATLRRHRFEPTHCYSFWFLESALALAWYREAHPGVVAFSRAHGYGLYEERNRLGYLPFRDYLLEGLDRVFPCSRNGARYLDGRHPGHGDAIAPSYLGTPDVPAEGASSVGGGPFRILSCSRMVDLKRVDLIARALGVLDAAGVAVAWTHYGNGATMDAVRAVTDRYTAVHAELCGRVPHAALLDAYAKRRFDLFVNVSTTEGLPLSIMEACGFGTPVVTTSVGGIPEIVRDGENGFLLPPDLDERMLADAIVRFMALGEGRRLEMRRASRRVWEEQFRARDNVAKMLAEVGVR